MSDKIISRVEARSFKDFWFELNMVSGRASGDLLAEILELRDNYDRIVGRNVKEIFEGDKRKEYLEGQDARYNYIKLMMAKRYEKQLEKYFKSLDGWMRGSGEGI